MVLQNNSDETVMNPENKDNNIKHSSSVLTEDFNDKITNKISDKFDLSVLGKIDLIEAEKIASEEVIFLTEEDLIEGLEDFELVPLRNFSENPDITMKNNQFQSQFDFKNKKNLNIVDNNFEYETTSLNNLESIQPLEKIDKLIKYIDDSPQIMQSIGEELPVEIQNQEIDLKDTNNNLEISLESTEVIENIIEESVIEYESTGLEEFEFETISDVNEELPAARKLFAVKINEETLDVQLSSILDVENIYKTDDKNLEKYGDIVLSSNFRFVDDQFLNKHVFDDSTSYTEDPLTERLVKMIDVADGKLELLEITAKSEDFSNYILEDYTLYNSEKFDTVFKEESFYLDSDFEFIDNAIIRDDFTKYIHEIDDYFESEDSLAQSEISEILGLIPDENEYIEDKLFGDYYKKYDLDNEIDFIKPEIDFFRSNYTGLKNLTYFTEDSDNLLNSEKISIEEDISSPNAIVFEEDISEIQDILKRDYGQNSNVNIGVDSNKSEILLPAEITDITDRILILEDKEKLMEFASEFPEKNENLIRLLSYLDGLFEKLPEEVIRKFAESEYFELYSKVLKEMGV